MFLSHAATLIIGMRVGAIVATLSFLLAGCAGSAENEPTETSDQGFGLGTSTIRGIVVSSDLEPIEGAQVQVDDLTPTTTDASGRFTAEGLAGGSHRVIVAALGYEVQARTVDVPPEGTVEIQFTLAPIPVADPYVAVQHDRGYSACDYMIVVITGRLPPPCSTGEEPKNIFPKELDDPWRFHVVELSWQSASALDETLRLFSSDDTDCTNGSPCYGLVYGQNYARLEGEPGKTEIVRFYDPWEDERGPEYPNGSFEMIINAQWIGLLVDEINTVPVACQFILQTATGTGYKRGCVGVGVSTGVPFDLYTSVFYWDPPEDLGACCPATAYSALPDS